jgi:uncharacterized membrane protein
MDPMTLPLLAATGDGPTLWTFFGRFHPATVHFPVALLMVATALEAWQILRRKPGLSPATLPCIILGLATALVATLMGWANASGRKPDEVLEAHRWAGVWTTVVALVATVLTAMARSKQGALLHAARAALLAGTALVGFAGHLGGKLVFGDEYYKSGAPPWMRSVFWPEKKEMDPDGTKPPLQITGKVDFARDIAPILEASCVKCHFPGKVKGKLRLDTKALAMKGGENGKVIVPGDPAKSPLYTALLLGPDDEGHMPDKADPLPKSQIEAIRRWIEEGAVWPEGATLKPLEKK